MDFFKRICLYNGTLWILGRYEFFRKSLKGISQTTKHFPLFLATRRKSISKFIDSHEHSSSYFTICYSNSIILTPMQLLRLHLSNWFIVPWIYTYLDIIIHCKILHLFINRHNNNWKFDSYILPRSVRQTCMFYIQISLLY